ncbi:stage II sporulation protein M [Paenibacillus pasadenensis]|uniref:stage II sporulation protein M n=1 Tax=Paenibacillus pasadenensis TaxID=217090 RepID=UPI00203C8481|nr:stage II sporulation protein M [Paenibacillus pasadenensis]MCM3747334.1 stage II sporulation protein M [Paenibacillus pasadenensis]
MLAAAVKKGTEQRVLLLFLTILFGAGVIFGALLASGLDGDQRSVLQEELNVFLLQLAQHGSGDEGGKAEFWQSFWLHGRWLLVIALMGLAVIGLPVILALDFFKGVLVGFAVATLAIQHGGKGLAFSLLSVLPANLLSVPAYLAASAASISFATFIIRFRLIRRSGSLLPAASTLAVTTAGMLLVLAGASALDAWLSPALMAWAAEWLIAG